MGEEFPWESLDGREDREVTRVDEGRCPHTQDIGAREDKNDGDRTKVEAERRSYSSKGNEARCYIRARSDEEANVT